MVRGLNYHMSIGTCRTPPPDPAPRRMILVDDRRLLAGDGAACPARTGHMSPETGRQGVPKIALQLPASHVQRPPQSSVSGAHCIVHITSVQSGLFAAGTQLAG